MFSIKPSTINIAFSLQNYKILFTFAYKLKVIMKILLNIIRLYPVSCLCIAAIWVLCLIPIPETPLNDIRLIDKWTHFALYAFLCAVMWTEYGIRHKTPLCKKALFYLIAAPILMGGLIEIAQATCTGGNRSGDLLDWAADAVGVAIGQLIGIPLALIASKRNKG